MKTKRNNQRLVTSSPAKSALGDDVRRLKSNRTKKCLSLVTSTPTRKSSIRVSLPTQLERDTLLTPEWVAESVVQEVERFLNARLPDNFAERLAAKAHYLYSRHQHFHRGLNRPGWRGRENLLMFMRHWTAGWLKRERSALYKKLPRSFSNGQQLS